MMLSRLSGGIDITRDINGMCYYPEDGSLTPQYYRELFDREAVANRVVSILPVESWSQSPTIYEDESVETKTEFEKAWDEVNKNLTGSSLYRGEEYSPLWDVMSRLDIVSGIGGFGLLLLGIDDGKGLEEPAIKKNGTKLLYIRAFDESQIQIASYEQDRSNPRFGQPTAYNINFASPEELNKGGVGLDMQTRRVHWTRLIHVADNLISSEIIGQPRLYPVLNRVLDLRKLYSSSPEMYFRGAFPGISFETNPQLGGDVEIDTESIKDEMAEYENGLKRYLTLMGMTAKTLSPTVVDPTPQINAQLDAICIQLGVPKRIFVGSERGELASSQDEGTWNDRLNDRRNKFITPRIIVPTIDRFISLGILPTPKQFYIDWSSINTTNEVDKANVANSITSALVSYSNSTANAIISPVDFLTRILGFDEQEAITITSRIKKENNSTI
jgi:hypothetical protein